MAWSKTRRHRHHLRHSKDARGFNGCPVSPIIHEVLKDLVDHGIHVPLISADRRDGVAQKFGKKSQKQLWDCWVARVPGCNPANPPLTSTHEYRNGGTVNGITGTIAYHTKFPFGAVLPPWGLGLDMATNADATRIKAAATKLGYHFFQPYDSGSELHHLNIAENPLPNLIKRGRA